jgi:hypothetical protein
MQKVAKIKFNLSTEDYNLNKMPACSANKKNSKMNKARPSSFNNGTSNRHKVQQNAKKSKNQKIQKDSRTSPSEFMKSWPKKYKLHTRKLLTA